MKYGLGNVRDWLRGSFVALVTPFRNNDVDKDALGTIIDRQIAAGTHGLVPTGTTGEASTLHMDEHLAVVEFVVERVAGRVPVVAGIGSNDTAQSIALAKGAARAGVDGLLAQAGYYNRPSQAGLLAHYEALADATDRPVVVYNVPARTACDITVETLGRIAEHRHVVGVKDASANLARVARQRRVCGEDFIQLSGEDATAVGFNAMGGRGCISVTANVAPELCARMQTACLEGRWDDALGLQDRLILLHDALFSAPSPGPAKFALAELGLIAGDLRLPMVPADPGAREQVLLALDGLGLRG